MAGYGCRRRGRAAQGGSTLTPPTRSWGLDLSAHAGHAALCTTSRSSRILPMDRPRRIFQPPVPRLGGRGVLILATALVAATGVALATLPRRAAGPVQATPATTGELKAPPGDVAVVDGGTLRLRNQVVRLLGVEPPARGSGCGGDCGAAATNALAAIVREARVACRLSGADAMGRPYAVCQANGTELNRAVIAAGWAYADSDAQPPLRQAEETARSARRGVWAAEPGK